MVQMVQDGADRVSHGEVAEQQPGDGVVVQERVELGQLTGDGVVVQEHGELGQQECGELG